MNGMDENNNEAAALSGRPFEYAASRARDLMSGRLNNKAAPEDKNTTGEQVLEWSENGNRAQKQLLEASQETITTTGATWRAAKEPKAKRMAKLAGANELGGS